MNKQLTEQEFHSDAFRYREWYQGCKGQLKSEGSFTVEDKLAGMEGTEAWLAEPKRDGIWVAAFFSGKGIEFYSRTQERKPYSLDNMIVPDLDGCLLVGELGFGSQESRKRRELYGIDFMDVFDILYYRKVYVGDEPAEKRRARLEDLFYIPDRIPENFMLIPQWRTAFALRYQQEPEGLILKPREGFPYEGGGKKVKHWVKVKKDHTVDMVIMGWKRSEAETKLNEPHVEYIACGMYVDGELKELCHVGSMTRELSAAIAQNYGEYHNTVVELKHFGQFRSGALRHPSVFRLRPDKRADQCVFDPNELDHGTFASL